MSAQRIYLISAITVAAALWFVMFSPWTSQGVNFWYMMTFSGALLTGLAIWATKGDCLPKLSGRQWVKALGMGLLIAAVLWCVFFVGDKVSQLLFHFARHQVDGIYGMKGDTSGLYISLALLLIIGPAEEIFWRGYVQRTMMASMGKNCGFVVATLTYTLIHIWSFNFMLIMAALVCGVCWGGLYRLRPQWLPALIISHAVWDVAAFVIVPF